MSGVNKAIILGRLGSDPELKEITGGHRVAKFSLATSEKFKDKYEQYQERTEWHNIVVWGKLADLCEKYLKKGSQVYLEGQIQTRSWEDQQGQKKYITEIVAKNMTFVQTASKQAAETEDNDEQLPF